MTLSDLEKNIVRAERRWRAGDFARAKDIYLTTLRERLIFVGENEQKFIAGDLLVIERLADLALLFGDFGAAEDLLSAMTALCEEAENFWVADYARLKLIHLALGNARLFEARAIFARMSLRIGELSEIEFSPDGLRSWENSCRWRDAEESDRSILLVILLLEMGRMLCSLGQYGDALAAFERGRERAAGEDQPELAKQLSPHFSLAQAAALLEKGEMFEAKKALTAFSNDFPSPEIALRINQIELQSRLYLLQGELGDAIITARRLIQMCRTNSFERAAVTATLNLVNVLVILNQTHLAEEVLRETDELARCGGETLQARFEAVKRLARARAISIGDGVPIAPSVTDMWFEARQKEKAGAVETAFNFLELNQSDNFLTFFEERALAFQQTLGWRNLADAQSVFEWLRQVFESSDSALIQNRLLVLEAMLTYYLENFEQAEMLFERAEAFFSSQNLVPELWQLRRFRHWCQKRTSPDEPQNEVFGEVTDALLEKMTASLAPADRSAFLVNKWTAEEEFIAGEINAAVGLREELARAAWWQRPLRKWHLLKRLNQLLFYIDRHKHLTALSTRDENKSENRLSESPDTQIGVRQMPLWKRLTAARKNSASLTFLVLPDRTLIVKSKNFSLDFGLSFVTRLDLRQTIKNWHLQMRQRAISRAAETPVRGLGKAVELNFESEPITALVPENAEEDLPLKISDTLQLTALLKTLPESIKALNIIPDDVLHGFPFAAVKINNQFLIERYSLAINFENDIRPPARDSGFKERVPLIVGASGAGSASGELAGVQSEIDYVSDWCRTKFSQPPQILYGEKSDKTMILQSIAASSFFHIASHGFFDSNNPQQSGLLLAEKNGAREMINLEDFFRLDLGSTQHITLSSCWSADHYILPGRWVVGLPETLWRAGAHSILGSIWFVDDEVAVTLMKYFYQNLSKTSRDESLRLAQLACLRRELPDCGNLDTSHPFFWAGFILYGATDKLWK